MGKTYLIRSKERETLIVKERDKVRSVHLKMNFSVTSLKASAKILG
jgi:hypothetical protein